MSKTAGTPFTRITRITRDEAAALWAGNGEVWALFNDALRQVRPLHSGGQDVHMMWSVRIIEDGAAEFFVRGKSE